MKKIFTFLFALLLATGLWAGNTITYTATEQLPNFGWGAFDASIVSHTFENGTGIITFNGELTSIGRYAFDERTGLTSITFPESLQEIGDYAFRGCTGLTSITFPESLQVIGGGAFDYCSGLTSITFPESLQEIGYDAFRGCTGLTSITFPDSLQDIGERAFRGCTGLTSITWNSIIFDGGVSFDDDVKGQITSFVFGEKVKRIPNWLCSGMSNLTSITLPDSLQYIGGSAFRDCSGLTSITFPDSLQYIGEQAFQNCTGLTSITIPNSVTSIGECPFLFCSNLSSIVVESGNPVYDNRGNCNAIIETSTNKIIQGCNNTIIPNSISKIGDYAFAGTHISSMVVPEGVDTIEEGAFEECDSLTSISLPSTLTFMGDWALAVNLRLADIYTYATTPPVCYGGWECFYEVSQHCRIHVPAGTTQAYQWAYGWSNFLHYIEMNEISGDSTDHVDVTVSGNYATFTWPVNPTASSYTLEIKKNNEVFCTLIFNSIGQLVGMAFAPGINNEKPTCAAQTAYGYSFVVTGLENATQYSYTFEVKDGEEQVIATYSGSFTTNSPADLESLPTDNSVKKYMLNGQMVIEKNGVIYNALGQMVK